MTGVEMVKHLKEHGFLCERVKGSHYRMKNSETVVIVPNHHKELGKGIMDSILKKAGLK